MNRSVQNVFSRQARSVRTRMKAGGASRDRTDDLMLAKHALSQLSYGPMFVTNTTLVGLGGVAPPTSPLSGVRSN